MGAFGEMMQARFGGTRHDMSTWTTPKPKPEPTKKELEEQDQFVLEQISGMMEERKERFMKSLDHLEKKSSDILLQFKTEKYQDKYMAWRDKFLKDLLKK